MDDEVQRLKAANEQLQKEVSSLRSHVEQLESSSRSLLVHSHTGLGLCDCDEKDVTKNALTVIVIGASGDLARKKTYPALYRLFLQNVLPSHTQVVGYARSKMTLEDFRTKSSQYFKGGNDGQKKDFLERCLYYQGSYDSMTDFTGLQKFLNELEQAQGFERGNRIFYMAIPPSIFLDVAQSIKYAQSTCGWNRVVVEKPFGHDLASSNDLNVRLNQLFQEDQLYRIDHYLGKEMVQGLMVLRFANSIYEPLWNRHHVSAVVITFKEDFGTEGRGGYFDQFGIIRDVMQNHLFQILSLVAMEPPVSLSAEDVRDEKVKLLRSVAPIRAEDIVLGQYVTSPDGKFPGYRDDPTVPAGSNTPTYACAVVHINNTRWMGIPFIIKCGKALDGRKAEVRLQFRRPPNNLFEPLPLNELVIRVQPNEAVYLKTMTKKPGLSFEPVNVELDLTYHSRFNIMDIPDAYERLILEVIRGDHNLFVRNDELEAAWKIVDQVLAKIDTGEIPCRPYPYGSRGPSEVDDLISRTGYIRSEGLQWPHAKI